MLKGSNDCRSFLSSEVIKSAESMIGAQIYKLWPWELLDTVLAGAVLSRFSGMADDYLIVLVWDATWTKKS